MATITNIQPGADHARVAAARLRMQEVTDALKDRFFERDDVIDGLAVAIVARANVFLLGEPGTAKSATIDAFCEAVDGRFFSTLCNRFQPPEEVLGMLSLKGMQEDRYVRRTTNRLPEADIAFLDEMFKSSAALLNTLLRITNEHVFEQDGVITPIPARLIVGASNELPDDGDGLAAFYDRFLLRFEVPRLQNETNVADMLLGVGGTSAIPKIALADIDVLSDAAKRVEVTRDAVDAVIKIRAALHEKHIVVSDRRWRQSIGLLRAAAVLKGSETVNSAGLSVLEHCLWQKPDQRQAVKDTVRAHVATWIKATREAHQVLDEQLTRIAHSAKSSGPKHEAIAQLGRSLQAVTEVAEAMSELASSTPEAKAEVELVKGRIQRAKNEITSAMRLHGIGV